MERLLGHEDSDFELGFDFGVVCFDADASG
jgi:hypothetical protein